MTFNKYAQFPNVPGIIIVRNKQGQHLFTMYTDNIRARIESVDNDHIKGTYGGTQAPWSQGRIDQAQAAGVLVWEYVEMPTIYAYQKYISTQQINGLALLRCGLESQLKT